MLIPIAGIVDAIVAKLSCTRSHSDAKRFREALQRLLWDAKRLEARVCNADVQPRVVRDAQTLRRIDIRLEPAHEVAARQGIVDAQQHMCAEVGRRPRPDQGRLDLMQVERRHRRTIAVDRLPDSRHGTRPFPYPIRSRNCSSAFPIRFIRLVSATLRSELETYHAAAGTWCFTIQSFTPGLRIPGHPSMLLNTRSRSSAILLEKSSMYASQSPSYAVANRSLVSLSRNTKRMSCNVPTLSAF